jgi:hypothetical protein
LFSSKNVTAKDVIIIIINTPTKKIIAGATVTTQPAYEKSQEPINSHRRYPTLQINAKEAKERKQKSKQDDRQR